MSRGSITGIVLAGGRSSRMGSNKAFLQFAGKSLLEHSLDLLRTHCEILVISGDPALYSMPGVEVWPDEIPGQAAMLGIFSCLQKSSTARNFFLSCDMPLLTHELVEYLLQKDTGHDVVLPVHDEERLEPLCAVYSRSVLGMMEKHIQEQDYSLHRFIRKCNHLFVRVGPDLPFYSPDLFLNVNTAEDMARANRMLEGKLSQNNL